MTLATASLAMPVSRPAVTALVVERVEQALRATLAREAGDDAACAEATRRRSAVEATLSGPTGESLGRLARIFRLGTADLDVLQASLAHALEPRLGPLLARIHDHAGHAYVTPALVARAFGHSPGRVWNPGGALAVWGLVTSHAGPPGEPVALRIDPVVPAWLEGAMWVDRALAGCVRSLEPTLRLPAWPLDVLVQGTRHALACGRPVRLLLRGEPGAGRRACAAAAAQAAGLTALEVDTDAIDDADWPDRYVRLQRLAAVSGAALVWVGERISRPWPRGVAPAPVHFVLHDDEQEAPSPVAGIAQVEVEVTAPDTATRVELWRRLVPAAATWAPEALGELAARYRLGAGDLARIAEAAPATLADATALARASGRVASETVQVLPCPYAWDDLVLTESLSTALADFAYEAAAHAGVFEHPGAGPLLARESGVVALFTGPSGTGKTMAAQVVAAQLGLDLLRVDIAAVMSKYIGESAKNLRRVFAVARRRQAVLLFDEADACFTRRTEVKDAHDRYANADTNYLLQLLEAHRGPVILASNRRADIDPAFVRRLRHVLEFARPEAPQRRLLWRQALQSLATVGAGADDACQALAAAVAEEIDLTGAQVRNAALSALFASRRLASPVGVAQLLRGVERELAKDGRSLPPRWREKWIRHA